MKTQLLIQAAPNAASGNYNLRPAQVIVSFLTLTSAMPAARAAEWGTKVATLTPGSAKKDGYMGMSVDLSSDGSKAIAGGCWSGGGGRGGTVLPIGKSSTTGAWIVLTYTADNLDSSYGFSVGISGHGHAIIGAPDNTPSLGEYGKVCFWEETPIVWRRWQESDSFSTSDCSFGESVAIHNDTAVIGRPDYNSNRGAVYIYEFDGSEWNFSQVIVNSGSAGDFFGRSVSITDNFIAVGAPGMTLNRPTTPAPWAPYEVDTPSPDLDAPGAVLIYKMGASEWELDTAVNLTGATQFGGSVAIDDEMLVATGIGGKRAGLFRHYDTSVGWTLTKDLMLDSAGNELSNVTNSALTGAVGIDGDYAAFGAKDAARVFVYRYASSGASTGWTQNGIIAGTAGTYFGYSVDVNHSTLSSGKRTVIVGAPLEDSSAYTSYAGRVRVENSGAVYFYEK